MSTSNENLSKTKVVDLEKLHEFSFQYFFIWVQEDRENFSLPRGPSLSSARGAAARRRRTVDAVDVHLDPQEPPNLPLGTLAGHSLTCHASKASWGGDTPPAMWNAAPPAATSPPGASGPVRPPPDPVLLRL